jgi:hypothetical protein
MYMSDERISIAAGDELKRIIELLLDRGADVNAMSPDPFCIGRPRGTLFYFHGSKLWVFEGKQPSWMAQHKTVFKRLEASGCEFSRPLETSYGFSQNRVFEREVREFTEFKDQIDSKLCIESQAYFARLS